MLLRQSAYGVIARRFGARNSKFISPRTDPCSARRFGLWDEFRKDKSFQELGEELSKAKEKIEKKAGEIQDSETWNKSTEFAESQFSSTKTRFAKLSETVNSGKDRITETFQKYIEWFSPTKSEKITENTADEATGQRRTFVSRISSVRQKVASQTMNATKRMGDATRAMGAKTREKIKDMYGTTVGRTRDMFNRSRSSQREEETFSSPYSKILMIKGCVGGSAGCNGFYRLQPDLVNDRPIYKGPKLEIGEHVMLWFNPAATPSQWTFTRESLVNSEEEITPLAYVEDEAPSPLEISDQWHIALKPGRYRQHAGVTVTNELPSTPPPTDALVVYEAELSWFQSQSRKFIKTRTYKNMQSRIIKIQKTESFKKITNVGGQLNKNMSEAKERYDESQHPMVQSMKDKIDYVSLETEHGAGINAIRRDFMPDFWPEDFIDYAAEEIIPVFCKKFLEGDMTWLRLACTGEAERACFASVKERMTQDHFWDETILWIHDPLLEAVLLENKKPFVRLSVTIQHVDCSRNAKGEVVEGSPYKIANSIFVMTVTPFPENDDRVGFPWQLHQLATQRVHALM